MKYGAYRSKSAEAEIAFFITERDLAPGGYRRATETGIEPTLFLAESVATLIMQIYPWIEEAEVAAQATLRSPNMRDEEVQEIAERMTDGLVRRLSSEDSSIWQSEPKWIGELQPIDAPGPPD